MEVLQSKKIRQRIRKTPKTRRTLLHQKFQLLRMKTMNLKKRRLTTQTLTLMTPLKFSKNSTSDVKRDLITRNLVATQL